MKVVPFIPQHLEGFRVHENLGHIQDYLGEDYAAALLSGIAYSGVVDGYVVAIAGMVQAGKGRWIAWALMTEESGKYMLPITRIIKSMMESVDYKRIETPVKRDFLLGHKWMSLLGFKNETPDGMKNYEDGMDFDLYARCK